MTADITAYIPVRDAAETLRRAVASLVRQTLPPAEILLVLNGCQDDSARIAGELARESPLVKILDSPAHDGVAGAARLACDHARYDLIARLDADDTCDSRRLEHQLKALAFHRADLVTCRVDVPDPLGQGIRRYVDWANSLRLSGDFAKSRFIESPVIQPGTLMRKPAYIQAGGYRIEDGPEDYDLWLRMLGCGARMRQADRAILFWHDSPQRLTRTHDNYSKDRMSATKARHLARLPAVREHGVLVAGAGPQGRRLVRHLLAEGVEVRSIFDVDPAKIGRCLHGVPVRPSSEMNKSQSESVLLGAVGHAGRDRVRGLACSLGYEEGRDYFACC